MGAAELRVHLTQRNGMPPAPTLTARLMRHALAWDLQSKACESVPKLEQRAWSKLMSQRAQGETTLLSALPPAVASSGTRLLKDWGGITHEVVVSDDAVIWNDQPYNSLSAVATAITGTKRNGPRFFGLRG
ncbi:MAG: DUF2924 domain-containing protein [Pseudomonadota bacterium]